MGIMKKASESNDIVEGRRAKPMPFVTLMIVKK